MTTRMAGLPVVAVTAFALALLTASCKERPQPAPGGGIRLVLPEDSLSIFSAATVDAIRRIGRPDFMEVFAEVIARRDGSIPLSDKPLRRLTSKATTWVRRIVKAKWLPEDIDRTWLAMDEVAVWETVTSDGKVSFRPSGDYLITTFKAGDCKFVVAEDGDFISLLVDLPESAHDTADPSAFAEHWLSRVTNLSADAIRNRTGEFRREGSISYVTLKPSDKGSPDDDGLLAPGDWKKGFAICTDCKTFIFVKCFEHEPGKRLSPRCNSGPPERFGSRAQSPVQRQQVR